MSNVETNKVSASNGSHQSLLIGETEPALWEITLTGLLQQQKRINPTRECVVFLSDDYRATYEQLYQTTLEVAKRLLAHGIHKGDKVGIFAANIPAYVELLFAVSHVGGSLVVFNTTYTPQELHYALKHSGCKAIFVAPSLGKVPTTKILDMLGSYELRGELAELETVILLKDFTSSKLETFDHFRKSGETVPDEALEKIMSSTSADDVCNFQYTSGTTGKLKAAMLSHRSIINNGRFVGDRMSLTPRDILCCPPPLFHCFGLVLGLLAFFTHGACIVFPSETFQPSAVLEAVSAEKCTALHGVPAMFSAELELFKPSSMDFSSLRTGIAAGAPVPKKLMVDLRGKLNMVETTITYGMTETAPASFMSFTDDPLEKRLATVGKILPHTKAKIVNGNGEIVAIGTRGELWVSGFQLQKGYWKSPEQTADAMILDTEGCLWMKTGDEAIFDEDGYCSVTGRIKDIIIRGGENIAPLEIEERLGQHKSIVQSSVVGLPDQKYGEVVCAFLQQRLTEQRPSSQELRDFVRQALGWHKAPVHIFWLHENEDFPKTGSGKIQKHLLRAQGVQQLKHEIRMSKL